MRGRWGRFVSAAFSVSLCMPFWGPASAQPSKNESIRATGHMTVTASGLAYTELRVPRPARLSLDYYSKGKHPTPRFSAGSRFGAIVLVSESDNATTYVAARLERSKGASQRLISLGPGTCQVSDSCEVPAGEYRLYLVTEELLTVAIEFQGLSSSSSITTRTAAKGELSDATESYFHSTPEGSAALAATGVGFSPEVSGESNFLFSAFWFRGPQKAVGPPPADQPLLQVGDAGDCYYFGSAPPAEAYAPGCPQGQMGGNISTLRALDRFSYLQWGSIANIESGTYGRGHYAVHTGIHHPGFVGFWLDIGD